ncbi:MAG: RNA 2',3'-cyclic phosphodiesterase [Candidatus Aenigmatarchaeota archaeon]
MRAFVAIFPPKEIVDYVESIKEKLFNLPLKAKFVERENLHISITFLGEIDEKKYLPQLDEIAKLFKKFEVGLNSIKLIPNESFVRVIALNVFDENNSITKIAEKIGGDYKEPHLTLARVKEIFDRKTFKEKIALIKTERKKFNVEKISFVESILTREGPIYKVVKDFPLL